MRGFPSGGGHDVRVAGTCEVTVSVLTNAFSGVKASLAIGLAYRIAGLGNAGGPLIGGMLTATSWAGVDHGRNQLGHVDI